MRKFILTNNTLIVLMIVIILSIAAISAANADDKGWPTDHSTRTDDCESTKGRCLLDTPTWGPVGEQGEPEQAPVTDLPVPEIIEYHEQGEIGEGIYEDAPLPSTGY